MSSVDAESIAPEHAHAPGVAGASKRTFKCAVHAEGAVSTGLAPQKHVKRWLEIGGAFDGSEREDLGGGIELVGKQYYSNGNRGVIFTADYLAPGARPRRVAIKELLHEKVLKPGRTFVEGALESEAKWLRELNQIGIGPELLYGACRARRPAACAARLFALPGPAPALAAGHSRVRACSQRMTRAL
jgi:hypothetical protein